MLRRGKPIVGVGSRISPLAQRIRGTRSSGGEILHHKAQHVEVRVTIVEVGAPRDGTGRDDHPRSQGGRKRTDNSCSCPGNRSVGHMHTIVLATWNIEEILL
jgi:hypothetical protein